MTWNNKMSDVFTLAHELGHAGHFKACNSAQSVFDTDVSTYFVEAPLHDERTAHGTLPVKDQ